MGKTCCSTSCSQEVCHIKAENKPANTKPSFEKTRVGGVCKHLNRKASTAGILAAESPLSITLPSLDAEVHLPSRSLVDSIHPELLAAISASLINLIASGLHFFYAHKMEVFCATLRMYRMMPAP